MTRAWDSSIRAEKWVLAKVLTSGCTQVHVHTVAHCADSVRLEHHARPAKHLPSPGQRCKPATPPPDPMEALDMLTHFRPAEASDAPDIARFFQLTSEGMADYIWSKLAAPGEALLSVGAARYAREQGDFSYKNCLMATCEGRVIGMMHSYALHAAPDRQVETDPVLAPYADMEIPDTLYISSLALDEAWRSQGLGVQFLRHAQQRAEDLGLQGLCLIDYAENHGARRFYERHGFKIVKTCQIVPHPMLAVTGEAYLMYRPNPQPAREITMTQKLTVFREMDIQPVRDLPFFEEVVEGDPHTLTSKYYHDEQQGRISGEWEASTGAWRIDYKVWEFCHVLSGRCVIELDGCAPVTLAAGDTFIIEPGAKGKWTVLEDMKKNFVILVPAN